MRAYVIAQIGVTLNDFHKDFSLIPNLDKNQVTSRQTSQSLTFDKLYTYPNNVKGALDQSTYDIFMSFQQQACTFVVLTPYKDSATIRIFQVLSGLIIRKLLKSGNKDISFEVMNGKCNFYDIDLQRDWEGWSQDGVEGK